MRNIFFTLVALFFQLSVFAGTTYIDGVGATDSGGGDCGANCLFYWDADSTSINYDTSSSSSVSLQNGAVFQASGGYDNGGYVECDADYHGHASITLGSTDIDETVGRVVFYVRVTTGASSEYVFRGQGQTGDFQIIVTDPDDLQVSFGDQYLVLNASDSLPANYFLDTWRTCTFWWDDTGSDTYGIDCGGYTDSEAIGTSLSGNITELEFAGASTGTQDIDGDELHIYSTDGQ